jgi:prolyl-tRNA editing enzyme YbaK/EbsC (Cys-tRNA(Pro) deacylase)
LPADKKKNMSTRAIQLLEQKKILINAGQRGTMLKIAPEIIRTVLDCTVADVAQQ